MVMRFVYTCLLLFALDASAQSLLQKADTANARGEFHTAIELYQKALKKSAAGSEKDVYFKIGTCYSAINNYKEAKAWMEKALESGYSDPKAFLSYGNALLLSAEYSLAKSAFSEYLRRTGDKSVEKKIASCELAMSGKKSDIPYEVKNMEDINSPYSEFGLAMVKEKLVFASSRIEEGSGRFDSYTGQGFSDVYEAAYDRGKTRWSRPAKVKGGINTKFNDGSFVFDQKTNTGYFMQCNGESGKKENCSIFYSVYNEKENSWSSSKIFDYSNSTYSIGHPAITSDANTLYFVSDMPGGLGGKDIWVIRRLNGAWGKPENIGAPVNTAANEMFPYVSGDTALFFSSDGHVGFGGLDIFYSRINGNALSAPVNMLMPINSSADDFSIVLTGKSLLEGYFCSNRQGGKGEDDIYSFNRAPIVLNAVGAIVDAATNKPVAKVMVYFKGSDGTIDSTLTDSKGGFNFRDLKPGLQYVVTAVKEGFFSDSKDLSTKGVKESMEFSKKTGVDLDFGLLRISKKEILIPNIHYDFNQAELKPESRVELDKLARILKETPSVIVQISAHTDEKGSDDYNMKLSQRRAENVVNYLISKGADKNRMVAKGYGETQPLKKNAQTEEDHQLNRRTTLKVIEK
jgi:peptidoglycan-associated lipoprotein